MENREILRLTYNNLSEEVNLKIAKLCADAYKSTYGEKGILPRDLNTYQSQKFLIFNKKMANNNRDLQEYIKSLKVNVLYFKELGDAINNCICDSIKTRNIPEKDKSEENFLEIQNRLKMQIESETIEDNNKVKVYDQNNKNNDEKRKVLQYDYMFFDIYTTILYCLYLVVSINKNKLDSLYDVNSVELSKSIDNICYGYTKMYLAGELL